MMRRFFGRLLLYLLWGVLWVFLLNAGAGLWTLKRLEKKSGTPIRGRFFPHLFRPAFTLKEAKGAWQNRFELFSGTLSVHYDPLSLLPGRKLRVQVEGQGLMVRLGEEWAQAQGLSEVKINGVRLDFAFASQGDPEIFLLDVRSPELQFYFGKKGRPR